MKGGNTMDMGNISQLVSSIGFPIVMCLIMCWFIKYTADNYYQRIDALVEKMGELSEKITVLLDKDGDNNE